VRCWLRPTILCMFLVECEQRSTEFYRTSTAHACNRYDSLWVQVFVEYVMLAKVNDSEEQAHQLGVLLQGRAVVLNLIPWNPVYSPEFEFEAPGQQRTDGFQNIVRQYGVHCTVRQEKGQDISGMADAALGTVDHEKGCLNDCMQAACASCTCKLHVQAVSVCISKV